MKSSAFLIFTILATLVTACQAAAPVCPPDSISYVTGAAPSILRVDPEEPSTPILVEIDDKEMLFDDVIHGALCGGEWQGTVYVACDLQLTSWEEEPNFLEGCELDIAPGTVVYVAAHNNEPYYQGCSCHTGEGIGE